MHPIPSLLHSELSVFFTQSMYFVNESETMALVTIQASGVSQESYTVTVSVNPGTATCERMQSSIHMFHGGKYFLICFPLPNHL